MGQVNISADIDYRELFFLLCIKGRLEMARRVTLWSGNLISWKSSHNFQIQGFSWWFSKRKLVFASEVIAVKGRWGDFMPVCFFLWIFTSLSWAKVPWSASHGNSLEQGPPSDVCISDGQQAWWKCCIFSRSSEAPPSLISFAVMW